MHVCRQQVKDGLNVVSIPSIAPLIKENTASEECSGDIGANIFADNRSISAVS